jgi:hypothetical protein
VRNTAQLGLGRDGFDVWLASNGRDAIHLYRGAPGSHRRGAARCPHAGPGRACDPRRPAPSQP